jgi:enoyl-[acyl-carrier protein] reductase II
LSIFLNFFLLYMQRASSLFDIEFPIIQAGMIWCSGWRLASAVSNSGGLGIIGAGSMYPDVLREHIQKCKVATKRPFAVNVPLLYPAVEILIDIIITENVPIVFTSAGNPMTWTGRLRQSGIKVVHVVSSVKFAIKAMQAGVDAIVAEGFEAGGHNGREETTTMVLVPMVRDAIDIPLIAAGGISDGRAMFAAEVLGADAVQIGSRFAVSAESSAHSSFKEKIIRSQEGDTILTLKQLTPVRLMKNQFYADIARAEQSGAGPDELQNLLGTRRAKRGIFEGDLEQGELEIGQVSARIRKVQPAAEIVKELWAEYLAVKEKFCL